METNYKKTISSDISIKPEILEIDRKFKRSRIPNQHKYRYLKNTENITEYCYVTIIFVNSDFLPALLNSGYTIKNVLKSKYNTVCFVQDVPHSHYPGLSKSEIESIKKVFDVVIGIDLLETHVNFLDTEKYNEKYKNIIFYCNKIYVLGLTQYKKIIYMDASTYLLQNIDFMFDMYHKSTYFNLFLHKMSRGLIGGFIFIEPKKYYLKKAMYLIENYSTIFNSKKFYSLYTVDEDIFYYSIFPNWNSQTINNEFFCNSFPQQKFESKTHLKLYPIMLNMALKPFRYPLLREDTERFLFNNDKQYYKFWDERVNILIAKYPEFKKYFEYIKTFRYHNFNF